jgi:hypothetical protein
MLLCSTCRVFHEILNEAFSSASIIVGGMLKVAGQHEGPDAVAHEVSVHPAQYPLVVDSMLLPLLEELRTQCCTIPLDTLE